MEADTKCVFLPMSQIQHETISSLSAKWDQPVWEQVFQLWLHLESLSLDGQLHIISLFVFFLPLQSSSQQEIYWAAKLWSSNWLRKNLNEFLNIQLKSIVTLFILGPRQIEIETINGSTSFWKNEGWQLRSKYNVHIVTYLCVALHTRIHNRRTHMLFIFNKNTQLVICLSS